MTWLCVSVHDISPETWARCERLLAALDTIGRFPLTLLVVPNYFRRGAFAPDWYRKALQERVVRGDELALHGYTHWDESRVSNGPWESLSRRSQSAAESEFATLSLSQAAERLEKGRDWFARQGWSVQGFIAPGWLLSRGTWQMLERGAAFAYTTTVGSFHLLHPHISVPAPSVTYSTRSRLRRSLSHAWNATLTDQLLSAPLVRLALHPSDADHSAILVHIRRTLDKLLALRRAVTKAAFASRMQETLSVERIALAR
jgi:predicted deacetylase